MMDLMAERMERIVVAKALCGNQKIRSEIRCIISLFAIRFI